jgi:hypothetical protein
MQPWKIVFTIVLNPILCSNYRIYIVHSVKFEGIFQNTNNSKTMSGFLLHKSAFEIFYNNVFCNIIQIKLL